MRMEVSKGKGLWPPLIMRRDLSLQYSLTLGQGGKHDYPAVGRGIIILYFCMVHGNQGVVGFCNELSEHVRWSLSFCLAVNSQRQHLCKPPVLLYLAAGHLNAKGTTNGQLSESCLSKGLSCSRQRLTQDLQGWESLAWLGLSGIAKADRLDLGLPGWNASVPERSAATGKDTPRFIATIQKYPV